MKGFSDIMAISPPYLMAIAKRPSRNTNTQDKRAEKFILAASKTSVDQEEEDGRFIQTPVRFPKSLLARIDMPQRSGASIEVVGSGMRQREN
jgi:hypothetical protein